MRKWLTSLTVSAGGVAIGAAGMYFYTKGRVVEASRLVAEHHALEKKYNELETRNAELQLQCSAMEHHKQQEGVFYAETLRQHVEILNLKRSRFALALRSRDPYEVMRLLDADPELAVDLSSPINQDTWLHTLARTSQPENSRMAEVLLDYGADPNARNRQGQRPIDIAREFSMYGIEDTLRSYKPKKAVRVSAN